MQFQCLTAYWVEVLLIFRVRSLIKCSKRLLELKCKRFFSSMREWVGVENLSVEQIVVFLTGQSVGEKLN